MPNEPGELDQNSERYLENALANGSAILFTGAGFSRGARNQLDEPLPLGRELAQDLWGLAFPGEVFDPASALGDVFEVARRSAGNATKRLLEPKLLVVGDTVVDYYRDYLTVPWFKIYTLNLDNLIPIAAAKFALPTDITSVSALRPRSVTGLAAVHLNGLVGDYPDVTFSPPLFGHGRRERTRTTRSWRVSSTAIPCSLSARPWMNPRCGITWRYAVIVRRVRGFDRSPSWSLRRCLSRDGRCSSATTSSGWPWEQRSFALAMCRLPSPPAESCRVRLRR
jgi:hypothetical protein